MSSIKGKLFEFFVYRLLISFSQSALFAGIRHAISGLDEIAKRNDELRRRIGSSISEEMLHPGHGTYRNRCDCNKWRYLAEVERLSRRVTIGLLEDGTIFSYAERARAQPSL